MLKILDLKDTDMVMYLLLLPSKNKILYVMVTLVLFTKHLSHIWQLKD